ncbi:Pycsar system effector family protein [Maribacter polysiphoniae]|uniref:Pycsar system effector family protein n=1 Tax=Maribacter polysiphoniae TaxID=429344 RepID=UPI00235292F3|nr:Pycsar system effector family protein [Maribacter polysiphoniae]
MEEIKEIEQSRYVLARFDHYIEGANSKGNFLLAFSAFLFGFIVTSFKTIVEFNDSDAKNWTIGLLVTILIVGLVSIAFTIAAVFPFLKTNNSSSKKYHSLVFFNSIADMEEDNFLKQYKNQKDKKACKDMTKQIYAISKGLKTKYFRISWAIRLVFVQLVLLLLIIIIKVV